MLKKTKIDDDDTGGTGNMEHIHMDKYETQQSTQSKKDY